MAHPEGNRHQNRPAAGLSITAEDNPPAAIGLGQIGLDTTRQASAVSRLGVATEEFARRDSRALEPSSLSDANGAARRARVMKILSERLLVEAHTKPRAVSHP